MRQTGLYTFDSYLCRFYQESEVRRKMNKPINRISFANLVIALGIIYGDIGTSPLYVLNAIIHSRVIEEKLILGSLSCIIWTLTLQTTIKYVWLTLKADNKGEGGIFSLYALVRRQKKWLVIPAMIGGAALLADGMITPPISVTSAIEGLRQMPALRYIDQSTIVYVVLGILVILFFLQQFGTPSIGKLFGPIMFVWFTMMAVLGGSHLVDHLGIFRALSPHYAIELLTTYPKGFWLLGAVFLCTTGAEALYSDLGHCGRRNIRISWIYVKTCLILNYLGQGAWLLAQYRGRIFDTTLSNPFYAMMPSWFVIPGFIIATSCGHHCQPGPDHRLLYADQREHAPEPVAQAADQLSHRRTGAVLYSFDQFSVVPRLLRDRPVFPKLRPYGSGLWPGDHPLHAGDFDPLFQLYDQSPGPIGTDLSVSLGLSDHRAQLPDRQSGKVRARRLCDS